MGGVTATGRRERTSGDALFDASDLPRCRDRLSDLHLWRLGPGHLGAIVSITTREERGTDYYRSRLTRFRSLSHLTIEVRSI
jgi:Co/Zn/Cd efflux system component